MFAFKLLKCIMTISKIVQTFLLYDDELVQLFVALENDDVVVDEKKNFEILEF